LDARYANVAGDTFTGDVTFETQIFTDVINERTAGAGVTVDGVLCRDNDVYADEIYLDTVNKDIRLYRVGADHLGLADQLSILNRADLNALVLGSTTEEGGDIVVYKDAAGGTAFQLDSDAVELGIGTPPVAGRIIQIQSKPTDTRGIDLDMSTNPFTGTVWNYGLRLARAISTGKTSAGFTSSAVSGSITNERELEDAAYEKMETHGLAYGAYDYAGFKETSPGLTYESERLVVGLDMMAQYYLGEDLTQGDNRINVYGGYCRAFAYPRVGKAAGTLTTKAYGIWARGLINPSIAMGVFVGEAYGGYFEGVGTTEGTQTVYGIYAKASGGDVNYAGYFAGADVLIEQVLIVDTINERTAGAGILSLADFSFKDDRFLKIGRDSDGILPTPSADYRGKLIRIEGGVGEADQLLSCRKKADDTYEWFDHYAVAIPKESHIPLIALATEQTF